MSKSLLTSVIAQLDGLLEQQYTVELGIQFALKVQSQLEKNGQLKEAVARMAEKVFAKIYSLVTAIGNQPAHVTLDPFNQFMMDVD